MNVCLLVCSKKAEASIEEEKNRAYLGRRMKALLGLKTNIESNQVQWCTHHTLMHRGHVYEKDIHHCCSTPDRAH